MRLVVFSRLPSWYSFKGDRFLTRFAQEGYEIAGVVVERTKGLDSLRDWLRKLGPKVVISKAWRKVLMVLGLRKAQDTKADGEISARPVAMNFPVHVVASHNSPECVEIVRSLKPDVLILRGCGIIRKPILDIPVFGTINGHYAKLPDYRGVDVTEWSVLHGDSPAVSVHYVNEGVDTGAVLAWRNLEIQPGDTLGGLREKCAGLSLELMLEVLKKMRDTGAALPNPPSKVKGRQYYRMHSRLKQLAANRLGRVM